jgi:archaeosine-15-forming tRNA-guanine transglycosylase
VLLCGKRLATVRAQDGRLTLGIEGPGACTPAFPRRSVLVVVVRTMFSEFIGRERMSLQST